MVQFFCTVSMRAERFSTMEHSSRQLHPKVYK